MKILDRYILVTYIRTFISVFLILMFIFVLQTIWLYISELAGKGLDLMIVLKFLMYFSPKLIPLVLPLTILVSSLMVFGDFAEKYEFAAMKSTGISLQRAMRSLTLFILLVSGTAFWFANTVIPYAEYKSLNLRRNIAQKKPAMVIAEGQFSQIGDNINILVLDKSGDRDQYLHDVTIHKKKEKLSGNFTVMVAEKGELVSEDGSNTLSLVLENGNYYDDIQVKNIEKRKKKPFAKSYFDTYTINVDLTEINNVDLEAEKDINSHGMYPIRELIPAIDTLSQNFSKDINTFAETMHYRTGVEKITDNYSPKNLKDSLINPIDVFKETDQKKILQIAQSNVSGSIQTLEAKKDEFFLKRKNIIKHEIALHEKYVFAIACIILFFIGAPLGAVIRKGGFGLPMVIAILLFLIYHFIGIFAKNGAEDGSVSAVMASWISSLVLLPLGIWITYRATTDQALVDFDFFLSRFRKPQTVEVIPPESGVLTETEKQTLEQLENHQLIDSVKNYKQHGYSNAYRSHALQILDARGISELELKVQGNFENYAYSESQKHFEKYRKLSKTALIIYLISAVFFVAQIVVKVYGGLQSETIVNILIILNALAYLVALIYIVRSFFSYQRTYVAMDKKVSPDIYIMFFLVGLPLYFIHHFIAKKKIKEDMQLLR
ncbi:MAG: LptF/LptG family permease [Gilvibacter sp.]